MSEQKIKIKICKKCGVTENEINRFEKRNHVCRKCVSKYQNTKNKEYHKQYYKENFMNYECNINALLRKQLKSEKINLEKIL